MCQSKTSCFVDAAIARAKGQSILVCGHRQLRSRKTEQLTAKCRASCGAGAAMPNMEGPNAEKKEAAFGLKRPVKVAQLLSTRLTGAAKSL
jgi:hypothetical protein